MKIVALFSFFLMSSALWADLAPGETYGLYAAVKEGFKHLSPFNGFVLGRRASLANYYQYGPDNDPIAKLVRELFYKDGDTFKITLRPQNIGAHITPGIIGALCAIIQKYYTPDKLFKPSKKLRSELTKELIEQLKGVFEAEDRIAHFVGLLVNAFTASSDVKGAQPTAPRYFAYFVLFDFMCKKSTSKEDLKPYFAAFDTLNGGILTHQDFWHKSYEQPDKPETQAAVILEHVNNVTQEHLLRYAQDHYEELGYALATPVRSKTKLRYPPHIAWTSRSLQWFKERASSIGYSDCTETALRNLLDYIFYDEQTAGYLMGVYAQSPLGRFYKQFGVSATQSGRAGDAFADLIANIPGLAYAKRVKQVGKDIIVKDNDPSEQLKSPVDDEWYYYELKSSRENILKAINYLLHTYFATYDAFTRGFNLTCTTQNTACILTDTNFKTCVLDIEPGEHSTVQVFEEPVGAFEEAVEKLQPLLLHLSAEELISQLHMLNLYCMRPWDILKHKQPVPAPLGHYIALLPSLRTAEQKTDFIQVIASSAYGSLITQPWYADVERKMFQKLIDTNDPGTLNTLVRFFLSNASIQHIQLVDQVQRILRLFSLRQLARLARTLTRAPGTDILAPSIEEKIETYDRKQPWTEDDFETIGFVLNDIQKIKILDAPWVERQVSTIERIIKHKVEQAESVTSLFFGITKFFESYQPLAIGYGGQLSGNPPWLDAVLNYAKKSIQHQWQNASVQEQDRIRASFDADEDTSIDYQKIWGDGFIESLTGSVSMPAAHTPKLLLGPAQEQHVTLSKDFLARLGLLKLHSPT